MRPVGKRLTVVALVWLAVVVAPLAVWACHGGIWINGLIGGGEEVGGVVQISAQVDEAADSIVDAQLLVDGAVVLTSAKADASGQYAFSLDTTKLKNGEHKLQVTSTLKDGKTVKSAELVITVANKA
jgi:hypothetical protein